MTAKDREKRLAYLKSIKCVHPEKCLKKISCQKDYQRLRHGSTQEKKCLDFVKSNLSKIEVDSFLLEKINKAIENPESNLFPDFLIEDGFIEHFQITASEESKKGSAYQIKEAEQKRNLNKAPTGTSVSYAPPHSAHDKLKESLKRNWESHIGSMDDYLSTIPNISTKIFMIEHTEMTLEMAENVYAYNKDFSIPQRHFNYHSLSHDVEMLEYIYGFKDKIDYVIYRHFDGIEIIKLADIPIIKKSLIYPFIVISTFQARFSTVLASWENDELICFHSQDKGN